MKVRKLTELPRRTLENGRDVLERVPISDFAPARAFDARGGSAEDLRALREWMARRVGDER